MGQTLSSYGKNLQQGRGWKKILAIVPVPLLIAIIIILAFINPTLVFEPPFLLPTLNVLLLSLIPFSVAYLAWKSYAKSGALPLLFVGCGMVAFGYGSLVAGFTINIPGGTNLTPTIHNTGALIGAISFVAAALFALWKDAAYKSPKHGGLYLGLCYLAVLIFMSLFTLAALAGLVPPFFVQGTGPTVLRQVVLGAATVLFAVSTIIFLRVYFRLRYDFTYWFGLALALITIGLYAVFIQKGVGTMVGWAGRTAQYLGCIYLLIGIISTVRLSKKKGIPLEKEITKSFNFIEANYKTLVEMASDAIISVNNKGTILTWNPAAAKIFGYSVSEATGTNVIDFIFPRESALLLNSELQKLARAKGQTEESGHKLELVARRKTGGDFPAEVSIATEKVLGEWLGTFIIRDISERKQVEEALKESETKYRDIFENALVGVFQKIPGGRFTSVNSAYARMHGYDTPDELMSKVIDVRNEFYSSPQDYNQIKQMLDSVGEVRNFEVEGKGKDGSKAWFSLNIRTVKDVNGNPLYYEGTTVDITERKKAEKALLENEKELEITLNATTDGIYKWNFKDGTLFFSPRYYTMLGYEPNEFPASFESWKNLIHPDDVDKAMSIAEKYMKSKPDFYENEFRLRARNGDYRWIQATSKVVERDQHGKAVRIMGNHKDITERKLADQAIRESEERYRSILEQMYDHYYEVDLAGNFTFLNESSCRKFGYSLDELIGKSYRLAVPEDDSKGLLAASKDVFKSGEPNKCYPHRVLNKDGSIIFAESFIGLRRNKHGEIIGFRTVSQDITKRKQAEEKLAESALQLVATNEGLRSALANQEVLLKEVHHRVKNNLMVVSSLLNLQMRRTTDQEAREALRESDTRIMSMAMIHEQVLQSGEYAAIDFTSYINDLVSNIRNSLAPYKKDVRLTVDVQPGIIIGLNQAVILGMIINEIASNSFKHAFQDCEKPEITISCRHLEDQVQVSIKDNGVGVPEETGIDNPSSLGLQLVNTLIKQLKGTIKYERDNGSKFTIMFRTKPESTQEVN